MLYPDHHDRNIVCRPSLHRLVGQSVTGSLVSGVCFQLPFSRLDVLILSGQRRDNAACSQRVPRPSTWLFLSTERQNKEDNPRYREQPLAEVYFCTARSLFSSLAWRERVTYYFMPPALTNNCVSNPAPKLPSPHLQAGYDEVHSFFWRKDFKEAITCYQDEPGNQIKTGFK